MKLKVRPVTSSQPPQISSAARRSVRGARRGDQNPPASRSSAAGSSQAIWPPISLANSRGRPVAPHMPPLPPAPPPPTLPVSSPVSRPRPL